MASRNPTTLRVVLDPDRLTAAERVALWQDAMNAAGRVHVEVPANLTGDLVSRSVGDLRTMRVSATTFRLERDREMAKQVRRDHVFFNLLERGGMKGRIAGRRVAAQPGALVVSRLASPTDIVLEDATWLALIIPRVPLERHMGWAPEFDARVFGPGTSQAVMLGGLLRSLHALPDPLPAREANRAEQSSLAFIAACLGAPAAPVRTPDEGANDLARPIRRFIAEHLSDPQLDVELICREFAISRSRLYRIMGESADIATIIRRLRLQGVQRDIASGAFTHLPLAAIGSRWGLGDERNFRRAFAREFGSSPSALRKRVLAAQPAGAADFGISADLERWFLGL